MPADPVSAVATAVTELSKVIQTWISGGDQKLRFEVKRLKKYEKACNIAEGYMGLTRVLIAVVGAHLLAMVMPEKDKRMVQGILKDLPKVEDKFNHVD